jgi:hypothetical protein
MKSAIRIFFCAALLNSSNAFCVNVVDVIHKACNSEPTVSGDRLSSVACLDGRTYRLRYVQTSTRIVLTNNKKQTVLHQIPRRFDPSLVGSDTLIGFLPDSLQAYKAFGVLLYISTVRTSGGTGSGQCGAGSEIYLNFLNALPTTPKVKSSILIGSCEKSIELLHQDIPNGNLGAVAITNNKLSLQFMNYMDLEGYPTATVSSDFKKLLFQ